MLYALWSTASRLLEEEEDEEEEDEDEEANERVDAEA